MIVPTITLTVTAVQLGTAVAMIAMVASDYVIVVASILLVFCAYRIGIE